MSIKIRGGTPKHGELPLCETCRMGHIMQGPRLNDRVIRCEYFNKPILMHVLECNRYDDRARVSVYEMQKIAWRFSADRAGKPIGFLDPKRYGRMRKEGKLEEDPNPRPTHPNDEDL